MGRTLLFLAALLAVPHAMESAGDAALDRATLRGLKSVTVVLDPLDGELQKAGLTRIDLQTRLETRLKDAGIPLNPSSPEFMGLRITSARATHGPFAVSFDLGLYQPVTLVRDRNIKSATATWEVDSVVMAEPKVLHQAAVETLDDLAARFVTAYRSVNPK